MAPTTKQLTPRKADLLPAPVLTVVQGAIPDCNTLLPGDISVDQFRAALWLELAGRPALHECAPDSIRACIVKAATYGMLPGRDCHLLPFSDKNRKQKQATFVPNYFGVLRTLYRSGMVEEAFAEVVYSNDVYDLDYGRSPMLIHKPPRKNRGVGEGAYGFIQVRGSARPLIHYMDPDDLDRVRRKAPAHDQGPWVTDPNEMKRKTALKNVAKYAPLPPQVQQLLADEDAREQDDIPLARHHQNITDLYGDASGASATMPDTLKNSLPNAKEAIRGTGGVSTPPESSRAPSGSVEAKEGIAWDTLRAHQASPALHGDLLGRIAAALSPLAPATDAEAEQLAMTVLEVLDNADEESVNGGD